MAHVAMQVTPPVQPVPRSCTVEPARAGPAPPARLVDFQALLRRTLGDPDDVLPVPGNRMEMDGMDGGW